MENTDKLPEGSAVIGLRQIAKGVKQGDLKKVVVASNCPEWLIEKIKAAGSVELFRFSSDEREFGTRLGKTFPVAAAGYR